jgi:hypothetical protein
MISFIVSSVLFIAVLVFIVVFDSQHTRDNELCKRVEDALPGLMERAGASYEKKYGKAPSELVRFSQMEKGPKR